MNNESEVIYKSGDLFLIRRSVSLRRAGERGVWIASPQAARNDDSYSVIQLFSYLI
jgi:hypothetical protein